MPSNIENGSTETVEETDEKTFEKVENTPPADNKAVHVALGAPIAVADLINQAISRWRDSDQREKDVHALRYQIEKGLNVAEEKGVDAHKQLSGRIEPTIQRVQTEVRERGGKVTSTTTEQVRKAQERVRGLA